MTGDGCVSHFVLFSCCGHNLQCLHCAHTAVDYSRIMPQQGLSKMSPTFVRFLQGPIRLLSLSHLLCQRQKPAEISWLMQWNHTISWGFSRKPSLHVKVNFYYNNALQFWSLRIHKHGPNACIWIHTHTVYTHKFQRVLRYLNGKS